MKVTCPVSCGFHNANNTVVVGADTWILAVTVRDVLSRPVAAVTTFRALGTHTRPGKYFLHCNLLDKRDGLGGAAKFGIFFLLPFDTKTALGF